MGRSNEDVERSEVAGRSRERRDRMVKLGWSKRMDRKKTMGDRARGDGAMDAQFSNGSRGLEFNGIG